MYLLVHRCFLISLRALLLLFISWHAACLLCTNQPLYSVSCTIAILLFYMYSFFSSVLAVACGNLFSFGELSMTKYPRRSGQESENRYIDGLFARFYKMYNSKPRRTFWFISVLMLVLCV